MTKKIIYLSLLFLSFLLVTAGSTRKPNILIIGDSLETVKKEISDYKFTYYKGLNESYKNDFERNKSA